MPYDKPKVTIDLDEYIFLKEKAESIDSDSMTIAAKKIAYACAIVMSHGGTFYDVKKALALEGIAIIESPSNTTRDFSTWESMGIKIKDNER